MEVLKILVPVFGLALYGVFDALADAYIFQWLYTHRGRSTASDALDFNRLWHRAQAAQQALVILVVSYLSGHWSLLLLGAGLFWLIHDGVVNLVGLGRPFFYVGSTAWTDRLFQRFPDPPLAMAVAKVGSILAGLAWLLWLGG